MICNSVCLAPRIVFRWDWWNRWNSARFGAATWTGAWDRWDRRRLLRCCRGESRLVPPVPPTGPTKINKTACSTTGSTRSPEARRFSRKTENVSVA